MSYKGTSRLLSGISLRPEAYLGTSSLQNKVFRTRRLTPLQRGHPARPQLEKFRWSLPLLDKRLAPHHLPP
jgi:hypothetical protein